MRIAYIAAVTIIVLVTSACAHQTAAGPTFEAFRGQPVSIEMVDRGGLFTASPDIVAAAKQAVERQLIASAITVADGSDRTMQFDIEQGQGSDSPNKPCVRVTARLPQAKKMSLSTGELDFQRCAGGGSLSEMGQTLANAIYATMQGSNSLAREPKTERVEARVFAEALGEVLAKIDAASQK